MAFIEDGQRDGLRVREFTLERGDRPVTGVLWHQPEAAAGAPLVCFGHGASGDRYQTPIPWLVERLVGRNGFVGLAIDGPVHGRRQVGDGARDAFWPEWKRPGSADDMTADWVAAIDFAQAQPEVGAGPVGYWGLSMGTIYGAPLVAAEPRITAAVLGLMGLTGPSAYRPVLDAAAAAIDVPVLFLVQLEDELFDREACLALFDALSTTDKRLHANAGLHPEVPVEEMHHSVDFLTRNLQS
ncbi:MAG: dienelactone hydrolase family protein [Actinomycetota bacterium]